MSQELVVKGRLSKAQENLSSNQGFSNFTGGFSNFTGKTLRSRQQNKARILTEEVDFAALVVVVPAMGASRDAEEPSVNIIR
ncbi:MYND finger family protein [Colletotrichum higginsianum]|nr:MYND finger family protein [Colletotrichum higginsianum]